MPKWPFSGSPPSTWRCRCGTEFMASGPTLKIEAVAALGRGQAGGVGHGAGGQQHVGQHRPVLGGDRRRVLDVAPRHDQHVERAPPGGCP